MKDVDRFSLFCDNLTGQTADEFKDAVSKIIGVCWYGLPNATDLWKMIDAGYAELLKVLIGQAQHAWHDDDQNADLWYGQEKRFTAKDRRILITHLAGNAYNKLITPQYDDFRWRLFEKTGLLMTADGSADDKVWPEGLPGYQIPPPAILLDPAETLPVSNEVDPCNNEEQMMIEEVDIDEDFENADGEDQCEDDDIMEDNECDRCYDDELVGRQVKGLYENGWFVGKIAYMIKYQDSSTDLVDVSDFDDVEMILITLDSHH